MLFRPQAKPSLYYQQKMITFLLWISIHHDKRKNGDLGAQDFFFRLAPGYLRIHSIQYTGLLIFRKFYHSFERTGRGTK